jgi:ligand-binding sensor domain-containing protein
MPFTCLYIHPGNKIKTTVAVFLCSVFVLLQTNSYGQNPPFISYNEQNGLSTSVVYGLFQDSEDNIWFCTNAGVVKFNGSKLTAYKKKDGLTGNEVFKIFEDSQHRLWFMTANGRISYYHNKKIYNEKDHPVFAEMNISTFISDIREDENHNIWIIPNSGKIYSLSGDLKSLKQMPVQLHNSNFFQYAGVNFLSSLEGIYSLQTQSLIMPSQGFGPGGFVVRHCQSGNIIFSGGNKKLQIYDLKNNKAGVYEMPGLQSALNSIVVMDSTLYFCSGKGLQLYKCSTLEKTKHYFSASNVSHVLRDREGSLWVSTLNEGVLYIPNSHINFLKSADFFEGNKILKVNGLGNHIIIGQSNSKVNYYHGGSLVPLVSPNESRGEGITYSIKAFEPDTGFVISTQSGITKFSIPDKLEFNSNIIFLGISFFDKNSAYISTPSSIGEYHDPLNLAVFRNKQNDAVFDSIRADALFYDQSDSVLYACSKLGLFRYKNKKRMGIQHRILDGLSFTDIGKNGKGFFITTTLGDGVFFFNKEQILQVNEQTGLTDNMCSSLFIQNDSTVWVATLNGLNRILCNYEAGRFNISIRNYFRNDGLPSNYINDIYIYRDSIWLATNSGLAIFNEKDLAGYTYTPKIAVDAFKANDDNKLPDKNKVILLERNNNSVIIEFNCTTFRNSGSVRYKYKLGGFNSNWTETRNNQVDFTGLAPGEYTFEIYAYNLNENWKTNTERVYFTIKPAFWETTWFRVLMAGLALVAILFVIFYQFRKVKKKFTLQKKIINYEKELLELEQQALRLQMNPHFIFNALNSIQHSILSGKKDDAYNSLELFSSLIRGILENSKHKFISLEDEIEILKIYIQIEAKRFNDDFKYDVKIDPDIDISSIKIPPMLIQPFVENSIWHGLMPKTDGEKKLSLSFTGSGNSITCKVEDNGIGRDKAAIEKSKKNTISLGTELTLNRVANINRLENKTKYDIGITDKENNGGTIVTITIQL